MKQIHVIPAPGCMTAEEAFAEIELLDELLEHRWPWQRAWCRLRHGRWRWAIFEVDD